MLNKLEEWNRGAKKWLWLLVIIGVIASLAVTVQRVQTEQSSKQVEVVMDYRDLIDVSLYQVNPTAYLNERLDLLKEAGVQSMAVFESSLRELENAKRIYLYNSSQVAMLQGKLPSMTENFTYVLFNSEEEAKQLAPMIRSTFTQLEVVVRDWKLEGKVGLVLETPMEFATLQALPHDPMALELLASKGFAIVPRLSDSVPYDAEQVDKQLEQFAQLGVKRILFDGESVKGFTDDEETKSLANFAELLKKHQIGIATIEGLKAPQKGFNRLAYLIDYNVVRIHSIGESESFNEPEVLGDRMALAVKDRNIRMFYLNAMVKRDAKKNIVVDSTDNLIRSMQEPGKGLAMIAEDGFSFGQATPFEVVDASWQRYAKALVVVGAVALIALLLSYFVPFVMLPAFVLGLIGTAGLFVLKKSGLLEQGLALGAAISAPTIAMILAIRRIEMSPRITSIGRRLGLAIALFVRTSLISLIAVPFVIALLNNITYSLVLNQFRGVSLLHLAPIALTALYVFLYRGESVFKEAKRWLAMPITVLWVLSLGVVGIIGMYYLSRTGNAGSVSSLEMAFRTFLESTFGVRPRNKEFLLAHPMLLAGAFIALRYRWGSFLFIIAVIGQLSMVDTFAHIHTPVMISLARTLLGMGLGLIIGVIAMVIWTVVERCWEAWRPKFEQ
ncbi:DUF5693 family protein [Paenibacillus agilis]|uniref:Uncharacterized protein n=1 Tax=Paenibacillus agilis TaxID=3020863 RepID=A0A559IP96_9BACL|nr:DUF5693 family protein [Paenibacillus agilis]TVX89471.1 hypothetical protein FPZ44_16970 [Paenibacillus agilis]